MRQSSLVIRNDTPLRLYFLFLCSIQDSFSGLAGFYCTPAYNKMPRDGIEPSFLDFQSNTLTTYVIWADTEISEISLGSRKLLFSLLYLRIMLSCPTYIFTLIHQPKQEGEESNLLPRVLETRPCPTRFKATDL